MKESLRNRTAEVGSKPETKEKQETPANSNEKKTRITLCIPAYGTVTVAWMIQYMRFIMYNMKRYEMKVLIHEHQPVDKSRNELVRMALAQDTDYIMWMDSDNLCPTKVPERLIKTMEETKADFVTALYFMKDAPYYPVIREYHSGGFWKIDNPALGQKFEIGGAGFGCCIMKSEIFKELPYPWFKFSYEQWGKKDIILSEDLYFCRNLIQAGKKLVCDASVAVGHIGGIVDVMEYMSFAEIRQSTALERNELTADLVKHTGRSEEEVLMDIMVGPGLMKEAWHEANPQTFEQEKEFYKGTDKYLYDLALYHFGEKRKYDIELCTKLRGMWKKLSGTIYQGRNPNVLDLGSGIGQNSLMLARLGFDVTLADLDSKTLDFAKFRFTEHDMPHKVWMVDKEEMPPDKKYDFILLEDVLEHLPLSEIKKYAEKIQKLKHPGTEVIMSNAFGKNVGGVKDSHPMHYEVEPEHEEVLKAIVAPLEEG